MAALYGLGGLVHIGNLLGFGEMKWSEAPISWKVGDLWWGALDIVAVIGVVLKSPVGLGAIALAAISQIIVYGFYPQLFVLTEAHHSTLRGLVYLNGMVLVILCVGLWLAGGGDSA